MAPHRARQLRVEVLRRIVDDSSRRLAAAFEARELLPQRERADSMEEAECTRAQSAVINAACEFGRALLALDAYEAGKMPVRARKVRP